jgi:hypothetical protein
MAKKFTKAILRLSNKNNHQDIYDLEFDLIDSSFLLKWVDRYLLAKQRQDNISEPWAFYNLNNDWSESATVDFLNYHINQCNNLVPRLFSQTLSDINDQDTLNYIHSVFELHHGKLDEWQTNSLFIENPKLREHLSFINQTVHRCESLGKIKKIRIVYFDLPKTEKFSDSDYKLFTDQIEFGGLYTLYADVGKNLESLATDNDDHHHDFVPNLHYSVDCVVKFVDNDGIENQKLYNNFLVENWDYFRSKGYVKNDPRLTTGAIQIAQLNYTNKQQILNDLQNYNYIQDLIVY